MKWLSEKKNALVSARGRKKNIIIYIMKHWSAYGRRKAKSASDETCVNYLKDCDLLPNKIK